MPVHHVPGGRTGSVFGYPAEIDAWLNSAGEPGDGEPTGGHAQPADLRSNDRGQKASPPARRRTAARAGPILALAVTTAILLWVSQRALVEPHQALDRVEVTGNSVVAWSGESVAWRYRLPDPADKELLDATWGPTEVRLVNQSREGERGVLANVHLTRPTAPYVRGQMLFLTSTGRLLWTYEPRAVLEFPAGRFDGPWRVGRSVVTDGPGGTRTWVAVFHEPWWPSFVIAIDETGESSMRFVNPGHIYALAALRNDAGSFVLVAGVNNEHGAAMLAVIEQDAPPTSAPASADYICQGCPSARPYRYFLFPRSELNRSSGDPYNKTYDLFVDEKGVRVSVHEGALAVELRSVYQLSPDFQVQTVAMSDAYTEAHRSLERDGRADHPLDECPEATNGILVRTWDRAAGWVERLARPAFRSSDTW